jgi:hypothetical protein
MFQLIMSFSYECINEYKQRHRFVALKAWTHDLVTYTYDDKLCWLMYSVTYNGQAYNLVWP